MIRLWDGRTGAYIATLGAHSRSVRSVTFSPDSSRLASASDDETVRLWDSRTIGHIYGSSRRSGIVDSVMFSPDGSKIALAGHDGAIRVCNGWTDKLTVTLNSHSNGIRSMIFSADGSRIASACYDGILRLWDNKMGRYTNLEDHSGPVNFVIFSVDGSTLVAAYESNSTTMGQSHRPLHSYPCGPFWSSDIRGILIRRLEARVGFQRRNNDVMEYQNQDSDCQSPKAL